MRRLVRDLKYRLTIMLFGTCLVGAGCVHQIHVIPTSTDRAAALIPAAVQLEVPFLAIEGADHMPGIPLLEWPAKGLQQTIVEYFTQRQTFTSIGTEPGDLRLVVKAWLMLRAPDRYLYRVHLESDLAFSGPAPIKTYAAEGEAIGSSVRWITSSDQDPITEATTQALNQLALQIEQDREAIIESQRR